MDVLAEKLDVKLREWEPNIQVTVTNKQIIGLFYQKVV